MLLPFPFRVNVFTSNDLFHALIHSSALVKAISISCFFALNFQAYPTPLIFRPKEWLTQKHLATKFNFYGLITICFVMGIILEKFKPNLGVCLIVNLGESAF